MGKRKKKGWEPKSYWRSTGVTERKSTDVSAAALVNHGESVIMQVVPVALHVLCFCIQNCRREMSFPWKLVCYLISIKYSTIYNCIL